MLEGKNPKYKILRLFRNDFKIRWTRNLPSEPSSITISFEAGDFYIVFNLNEEKIHNIQDLNIVNNSYSNPIGLDINNKSIDLGTNTFHKSIKISQLKNKKKLEQKISKLQKNNLKD